MTIISKSRKFLLDGGILYLYALFVAGYFVLPMAAGHRRLFYLLLMPAIALLWRELYAFYRRNALAWLVVAYTGYMMSSLAWTENFSATGAISALWYSLCVLGFVFLSGYVWVRYPVRFDVLQRYALWLAAGAAILSIVVFYWHHPFPQARLLPLGVMHDPNESGAVYGMFLVGALFRLVAAQQRRERLICAAAAIILLALVLFTQSRTALAAVCASLLVLMGYRALGLIIVAGAASWALLASNEALWSARVLTLSYRPGIWEQVLETARAHLWFGQGYLVETAVHAYNKVFSHAHDSYLASLRDGGLVGLALLLGVLGLAAWWAWQLRSRFGERIYFTLLVYAATCISMDFDRLLVQPKELWLFFWLPVALVMASWGKYRQYPRQFARGKPAP